MAALVLPERPLERFLELQQALLAERRWFEDSTAFRYAASSLSTLPGAPAEVAAGLRARAQELSDGSRWYGPLKSPVRFVLAAMLLGSELDGAGLLAEITRVEALFKQQGLSRGSVHSALAVLLLVLHARRDGHAPGAAEVERLAAVHAAMRSHHRFLTGQDDYPACALLVGAAGAASEIAGRCEVFYEGLRDLGFSRGNALQSVSHLLVFAPGDDSALMQRFRRLYSGFQEAGLWMHTGDYDEVAALSFLAQDAPRVVATVLAHREVLAATAPKPGRELSFSLACGTAFLELAAVDAVHDDLRVTANVLAVQAILQAQQAAMVAAAAGAAAASASH